MQRTVFLKINVLLFFSVLIGCSHTKKQDSLPYYNTPDFTPYFFVNQKTALEKINHRIRSFSFKDQHDSIITEQNIEGRVHVANFIFTSCISICPVMIKHMKLLQRDFGNDPGIEMLSYSVTPWVDSVGRLHDYAKVNGIVAANWHLLTGNKGQIYELARKSYFAEEDLGFTKDSTEFLHTEHIILVDKSKRIRGIYNGTLELEVRQLADDIRILLQEDIP